MTTPIVFDFDIVAAGRPGAELRTAPTTGLADMIPEERKARGFAAPKQG